MYKNQWYNNLKRSSLNPPSNIFSPVWFVLYISMIYYFIRMKKNPKCPGQLCKPLYYFVIQLCFNLLWTTLFFKLRKINYALIDIILIVVFTVLTIYHTYPIDKIASYILIPYLLWISFATYLNFYIYMNN